MKTDFSKKAKPEETPRPDVDETAAAEKATELEQQSENTCTAVAEPTCTAVQPHQAVIGDFIPSVADMRLPRLNIVHGVGRLKDNFPQKAIVYNQNLVVYERRTEQSEGTPPLEMVVLGWLPIRYAEKVPGGARGMLVNTIDEVGAAGGTLDWKEWDLKKDDGLRYFQTLAEAVVLFKRPDHVSEDNPCFPFVVENSNWALAIFAMKGTAYTNGAKVLFTARRMGFYKDGYPTCVVSCKTRDQKCGPNDVPVPDFTPLRRTSDAFQRFAVNLVNGSEEQGAAEE
jgi:hypothetical protein